MVHFDFQTTFARRFSDPVKGTHPPIEQHVFIVQCKSVPEGISNSPNARNANLNKRVYKNVAASLIGETNDEDLGRFHLKNRGLILVAKSVEKRPGDVYRVHFDEQHGILDGGHTNAIIQENKDDIPDDQYVRIEVRTNVPDELIPALAGALNTSIQVQEVSLSNLSGQFSWLKDELGFLQKHIAWQENEDSDDIVMDARELVSILLLFNVKLYPNFVNSHPTETYAQKAKAMQAYKDNLDSFKGMVGIVKQILELHDIISSSAVDIWNDTPEATKGGKLGIIEQKRRGKYKFPFLINNDDSKNKRLKNAVLYPILSSLRWFINYQENNATWACDFEKIELFWRNEGRELMEISHRTTKELRYQLGALGKNVNYWDTLHAKVGMKAMSQGLIRIAEQEE